MRKLNGITINGEFLGSGVVVNGMFRAICAISPVIMREFVLIINKIEALEEAVKISNFNCDNDKNRMDIEFENRKSKGIASLYFKLYNGEPELTDCKLVLDNKEYSTLDENIKILSPKNDMSEEEKKKKLQALKESKLAKLKNESQRSSLQPKPIPKKEDSRPLSKKEQKMQELLEKKRKALEEKSTHSSSPPPSPAGETDSAASESHNDIELTESAAALKAGANTSNDTENKTSNSSDSDIVAEMTANSVKSDGDGADNIENGSEEDNTSSPKLSLDDFTEEELENLSLEELEQLERELSGENYDETNYNDNYTYDNGNDIISSSNIDFAEKISHGIAEGITQGLTQGLVQGLSEGLSQGLSQGLRGYSNNTGNGFGDNSSQGFGSDFDNSGDWRADNRKNAGTDFGKNSWEDAASGNNENFDFSSDNTFGNGFGYSANGGYNTSSVTSPSDFQADLPDITNKNYDEALKSQNSYSYDENSNVEELSDYYSDFYDNLSAENSGAVSSPSAVSPARDSSEDELEKLKAELAAFEEESLKNKMSLEEYMARQKQIEEAKEKIRRRKIRIVGSRGRVNAKAIEDGIYVSGSKIYKWGDTRHLEG